jgi:hypothetical protein
VETRLEADNISLEPIHIFKEDFEDTKEVIRTHALK